MTSVSSAVGLATYVVRLTFPDGTREEVSGCDSDDLAAAVRSANGVLRWLHGEVLYCGPVPRAALRDVFDLWESLEERGIDRFAVRVECVAVFVSRDRDVYEEVVWPPPDHAEDDDPEDTSLEPVVVQYTIEDDDPRN